MIFFIFFSFCESFFPSWVKIRIRSYSCLITFVIAIPEIKYKNPAASLAGLKERYYRTVTCLDDSESLCYAKSTGTMHNNNIAEK
jgi:hypothetical protein